MHRGSDQQRLELSRLEVGRALLQRSRAGADRPETGLSVKVLRQVKKVGVVALVGDRHVLVIEDKTDTANHSDQLDRYREALGQKYKARKLACVYLKTGDQPSYIVF